MPDRIRLYPECHADTALITFIVKNDSIIEHVAGINQVAKSLREVHEQNVRLIGIIDDDKHKPRYFSDFIEVLNENRVCLKYHQQAKQRLIIISKAIETFLIWNAQQVNINLSIYGFDNEPRKFGARLRSQDIETDPDYLRLLSDLHARHAPGFVTLERILNEFLN